MALSTGLDSLPKSVVRRVSRELRALGRKLPKYGMCARSMPAHMPARELCHDRHGYFWVGYREARAYRSPGYEGTRRKRRRR